MGILSKIGDVFNKITGAKQAQNDAQGFTKWQMANAHQQEVEDMKKAGLNPVVSAGGSGATEGVGAAPSSGLDPITLATQIISTMNNSKQVDNEIRKTTADIDNETKTADANVAKALKEAGYTQKQIDYYNKWGVFPGATTTSTHSANAFGLGGSGSTTKPIGLKEPTSAKSKSFWNKVKEGWNKQK